MHISFVASPPRSIVVSIIFNSIDVGILTFISMKNTTSENLFSFDGILVYEQFKCRTQLS